MAAVEHRFFNYSYVTGAAGFPTPRQVIVTVVPSHFVTDLDVTILSETAWRMAARDQGALSMAWSDILDDAVDIPNASYCRSLETTICARYREIGNPSQSRVTVSTNQDLMAG